MVETAKTVKMAKMARMESTARTANLVCPVLVAELASLGAPAGTVR
jgi:hypothetical protein